MALRKKWQDMNPKVAMLNSLANTPLSPNQDDPALSTPSDEEQQTTITNFRHDKGLKAFEKKRAIATLVIEDLKTRGRLIRTENREVYYFDNTTKCLVEIHDSGFKATLHNRFGLNATEDETRFMEQELLTHTLCHGEQTSIHRLAYWSLNTHTLYVSMNNGTMFVLNGQDMKQQDNGTDGVLFLVDRRTEPIDPMFSDDRTHFHALFNDLSIVGTEEEKEQMVALLQVCPSIRTDQSTSDASTGAPGSNGSVPPRATSEDSLP